MSQGLAPDYDREEAQKKILKMIPCKDEFGRMLNLSPKDMEPIIGKKPVLKDEKMTQKELEAATMVWEDELLTWALYAYEKFVQWNETCVLNLCEDELEHLDWLCDWIAENRVRNMDMESCGEFSTEGIYFNKDKKLVIYNGR